MKTQELTGALLALLVMRSIGRDAMIDNGVCSYNGGTREDPWVDEVEPDWTLGELILPKHGLIKYVAIDDAHHFTFINERSGHGEGSSFAQALCRAVVNAKYGDTVPDDLGDM